MASTRSTWSRSRRHPLGHRSCGARTSSLAATEAEEVAMRPTRRSPKGRPRKGGSSVWSRREMLIAAGGGLAGVGIAALLGGRRVGRPAPLDSFGTAVTVTEEMVGAGAVSSGVALPPVPPVTGSRHAPVRSWGRPLPYPIVIADCRNNRLLEVTPEKRIVWEFPSPALGSYRGNEDVNFSPDGRLLAVSGEDNYRIHFVDYDKRALVWSFGVPDVKG